MKDQNKKKKNCRNRWKSINLRMRDLKERLRDWKELIKSIKINKIKIYNQNSKPK